MVATVALAHDADNVVLNKEDSGGPSLPHQSYRMWASKKKGKKVSPGRSRIKLWNKTSNWSYENNSGGPPLIYY